MKQILTFIFCFFAFAAEAQWSNTTNQFYDSLDTPVAQAANDQKNPLVIKSDPDGGYFVIWEDFRNANGNSDIYAQKYDKDGHSLWATNGVPVATGDAPDQQYSNISNGVVSYINYQSVSHAASDGSGGFYITWQVYLASPLSSYGVFVQHVRNDGSRVFASDGYGLAMPANSTQQYTQPQLIADGNGGFFIGYLSTNTSLYGSVALVTVYCFKDEGGVLKFYGGGVMSDMVNYYNVFNNYRFCPVNGVGGYLSFPASGPALATTNSFKIFPDEQGGCGVVMVEAPAQEKYFPAFDQLCRVKKDCYVGTRFYKKDSVVQLYPADMGTIHIDCAQPGRGPGTAITTLYTIGDQGVKNLLASRGGDLNVYDVNYPGSGKFNDEYTNYAIEKINAAVLPTDGNINALLVTWNQRNYIKSQVTNWSTRGIVLAMEKYDSLPYQLCLGAIRPAGMNKINEGKADMDTLIAASGASYFYDYSLTGSGNRAFMITSLNGLYGGGGPSPFYYQEAKLIRQSADSFALKINTAPGKDTGVVIGIGSGDDHFPFIAGDGAGNATFYYTGPDGHDYVKASPVEEGGKLSWGALGLPLNSGGVSGAYYYPSSPFLYMDAEGKAVVAWEDGRKTTGGYLGENVYMRHLDSLLKPGYQPPLLKTQLTIVPTSASAPGSSFAQSNPQSLIGSSNAWTIFQVAVSGVQSNAATPVVAIKDDYNLGTVSVSTYDFYNQPLRTTNGHPYLDRNYTISVTNHPAGASIHVRLIFTKAEFDALKAADPSIQTPGDLSVIKQPNTGGTVPAVYTPSAGDLGVQPLAWAAIDTSGYYIELAITDFSNFFITKSQIALPLTWLDVAAERLNATQAKITWEVAQEMNTKKYNVQLSNAGTTFLDVCTVPAKGSATTTTYSCVVPVENATTSYLRVEEIDNDGHNFYSKIVKLQPGATTEISITPNPAKDYALLHLPVSNTIKNIMLINGYGSIVWQLPSGSAPLGTIRIPLATMAAGIYYVKVMDAGGFKIFKIIKSN